jgi:hypothetical protein
MANAERGEVDLTIGGKTYTLRLSTNAQAEVEAITGKSFGETVIELTGNSVIAARAVLFGALREHHKGLTLFDAGDLIDQDRQLVGTKIGEAIRLAFPELSEAPENPQGASSTAGATS